MMILDSQETQLLRAVRDWPLATAPQLAKRLQIDERQTGDLLRQALAAGRVHAHRIDGRTQSTIALKRTIVRSAIVGDAKYNGDFYTLSDAGLDDLAAGGGAPVPAYAAHYGVSHARHFRALMQVETTWWLYEALGKMRDQGYELHTWVHAPISIWSTRPNRFWPLALGVAALSCPTAGGTVGGHAKRYYSSRAIIVEWDTGDVLATAYRRRFDALYHWYQRLSDVDGLDRKFPVMVMLTTTGRRAMQLLLVWESCACERGIRTLPLFIAPWREALASSSAWRRPGNPGDGGRLLTGLYGVSDPLAAMEIFGFPPLSASAGDAANRVVTSHSSREPKSQPGERARWWSLDGVFARQVKPGAQLSRSRRLVEAQFAISVPGRHILERIAAWPLLSRREVAAVTNVKEAQVRDKLRRLADLELIASCQVAPDDRDLYHLTPLGISYLAATHGATASWYAAGRQWPIERIGGSREVELRLASLTVPYEHTQLTRWLFMSFLETARYFRQERMLRHTLAVWEESEARRHFFYRGQQRLLSPDAAGVYLIGNQVYEFLVESDMGTRHTKSLLQKFRVFRDYRDSMAYHQDHVRMPLVLVVTSGGRERMRELMVAAVETNVLEPPAHSSGGSRGTSSATGDNGAGMTILIASRADIAAHGLRRPVWLNMTTQLRQHCFVGFKEIPDSARTTRLDLQAVRREVAERLHNL